MKRSGFEQKEGTSPPPRIETSVPGLARVAIELRRAYPLLSVEAIARILRMPVAGVQQDESDEIPRGQ
jgi:hypothetical protein